MSEKLEKDCCNSFASNGQIDSKKDFICCPVCGSKFAVKASSLESVTEDQPSKTKTKRYNKNFIITLIKRSVVLAMAILMLAAAFLPMITVEGEIYDQETVISFGAIDGIDMFICSLYSLNIEDVSEELEDLYEEAKGYESDWEDGDELDKYAEYAKSTAKVALKSENMNTYLSLIFSAVLSVAQIVLSVLLVIFAAISFSTSFIKRKKDFLGVSVLLIGINAVCMFVNVFAFKLSFGSSSMTSVSAIQILTTVLAAVMFIAFFVLKLVVDKESIKISAIVKRSLSFVFAVIMILLAGAPILSTTVKTTFESQSKEKTETSYLNASLFSSFEISESGRDSFEDRLNSETVDEHIRSAFKGFSYFTKREYAKGEAESVNKNILSLLTLSWKGYEYCSVFALGTIAVILLFAAAAFLIMQNVYELATGKKIHFVFSFTAKLIAIISAILMLALIIVISAVATNNAKEISVVYRTEITSVPIFLFIFAFAIICVPNANVKRKRQYDSFFEDNTI